MKTKHWVLLQVVTLAVGFAVGGLYWGEPEDHLLPEKVNSTASDDGTEPEVDSEIHHKPVAPDQPEAAKPDDKTQPQATSPTLLKGDGEVTVILKYPDGSPAVGIPICLLQSGEGTRDGMNSINGSVHPAHATTSSEYYRLKAEYFGNIYREFSVLEIMSRTDDSGSAHFRSLRGDMAVLTITSNSYGILDGNQPVSRLGTAKYGTTLERTIQPLYRLDVTTSVLRSDYGYVVVSGTEIRGYIENGTKTTIYMPSGKYKIALKEYRRIVSNHIEVVLDKDTAIEITDDDLIKPNLVVSVTMLSKYEIEYRIVTAKPLAGIDPAEAIIGSQHKPIHMVGFRNEGRSSLFTTERGELLIGLVSNNRVLQYQRVVVTDSTQNIEFDIGPDSDENWLEVALVGIPDGSSEAAYLRLESNGRIMLDARLWKNGSANYLFEYSQSKSGKEILLSVEHPDVGKKFVHFSPMPKQQIDVVFDEPSSVTLKFADGAQLNEDGIWNLNIEGGKTISNGGIYRTEVGSGFKVLKSVQPGKYTLLLSSNSLTYFKKDLVFASGSQEIEVNLPKFHSLVIDMNGVKTWRRPRATYIETGGYIAHPRIVDGKVVHMHMPAGRYKLTYTDVTSGKHIEKEQEFTLSSDMTVVLNP